METKLKIKNGDEIEIESYDGSDLVFITINPGLGTDKTLLQLSREEAEQFTDTLLLCILETSKKDENRPREISKGMDILKNVQVGDIVRYAPSTSQTVEVMCTEIIVNDLQMRSRAWRLGTFLTTDENFPVEIIYRPIEDSTCPTH